MEVLTLVSYIIASVILFGIFTCLEKNIKKEVIHQGILIEIYILVVAGIFSKLGINCHYVYLLVLFVVMTKLFLLYYQEDFIGRGNGIFYQYGGLLLVTYLVNRCFIDQVDCVFLSIGEMKILLWLLIIMYLYYWVEKILQNDRWKKSFLFRVQGEYIVVWYARLKNYYGNVVQSKYKELIPLIYAIMIYENFQRPKFLRKIDVLFYRMNREPRKFGIMQVWSREIISDEKSIQLGLKKIEKIYIRAYGKQNRLRCFSFVLGKYYHNQDVSKQVLDIYQKILKFDGN